MSKPKFIKEIEKFEGKERAKCGRWYIRVYGELDHKPMVELESLEIVIKELHKLEEENEKLKEEIKERQEEVERFKSNAMADADYELKLEEENKKLKHENRYRAGIVDILPKGKGHIAEETIQDLQERINELVWFEKEYHRLRDRIKKLERVLEHEYNRKIPY